MDLAIALDLLVAAEFWLIVTGHLGFNADIGFLVAASLALLVPEVDLARLPRRGRVVPLSDQRRILLALEFIILATANAIGGPHVPALPAALGASALVACELFVVRFAYKNPRVLRTFDKSLSTSKNLGVRPTLWALTIIGVIVAGTAATVSHSSAAGVFPLPPGFQWPGIALLFVTFGCVAVGLAADRSKGGVAVWLTAAFVVTCSAILEWNGQRNWYFLALSLTSFLFLVPAWPPMDRTATAEALPQPGSR